MGAYCTHTVTIARNATWCCRIRAIWHITPHSQYGPDSAAPCGISRRQSKGCPHPPRIPTMRGSGWCYSVCVCVCVSGKECGRLVQEVLITTSHILVSLVLLPHQESLLCGCAPALYHSTEVSLSCLWECSLLACTI